MMVIASPLRESQLGFVIVPAQQTYVAEVRGRFVWMGDMWLSYVKPGAGRNVKAYDYQVRPTHTTHLFLAPRTPPRVFHG